MQQDIITAAVVNFKAEAGNKQANLSRMADFARSAARQGADLVLFPELCLMGYDYFTESDISQEEKIAATETVNGPSASLLAELAQQLGIYIIYGMSEKLTEEADILYNSAVVLGPDGLIGSYQKIHPFGRENKWCAKGEKPFLFDTKWGPIALGICFDTYQFPELMRYYVFKGARLYLNPTSVEEPIPMDGSRQAFRESYTPFLEYGVLSNAIFIATSNLTGYDSECYYGGGSMILGPKINPFRHVGVHCYCGSDMDNQVGMHLATLDLSLATRRIFTKSPRTGGDAYFRPEIYRNFYMEEE